MRRHSSRLSLDTTHFAGPRRWSDRQLVRAVNESKSWGEVLQRIGLIDDRRTEVRIKGNAVRLGLDIDHLEPADVEPVDLAEFDAREENLRTAAPALVSAWFSMRGIAVALPTDSQPYDLVVTLPDGIKRVQVKTTTSRRDGTWLAGVGHRPYSGDAPDGKLPYDPATLDLFAIINGEGEVYLVPVEALAGRTGIYLSAYERYRVGDVSSLMS